MNGSEIEAQVAAHEAAIEALRGLKQTRARTSSTPVPAAARKQPIAARRWELAAKAFRRFPFEPHTVRRICGRHPEWAVRLTSGDWYVDIDLFTEFAGRVESGGASFAVSALSASSVAADAQLAINSSNNSIREHGKDMSKIRFSPQSSICNTVLTT
jgi:hypothetical protein